MVKEIWNLISSFDISVEREREREREREINWMTNVDNISYLKLAYKNWNLKLRFRIIFIKSVPKYQTWTENKDHKEVKFVVYDAMK